MALVDLGGYLCVPPVDNGGVGAPAFDTMAVSATAIRVGYVFQAPKTGVIQKVGIRSGTHSTTTNFDIRLETVSAASGNPSGTLISTSSNGLQVITSAQDNTWFTVALTSAVSVSQGDYLAVVITPVSVTAVSVGGAFSVFSNDNLLFPFSTLFGGASWSTTTNESGVMALEYTSTIYHPIAHVFPYSAINTHTFNNTSTPDVYALKFMLPYKARAAGMWVYADFDSNCVAKLYNSDGATVLSSVAITSTIGADAGAGKHILYFTTPTTIEASVTLYLGIEPTGANSSSLYSFDVVSAAVMNAVPMGTGFTYATAKDPVSAGSWTETATRRLFAGLILDQIDYSVATTVTATVTVTQAGAGGTTVYTYAS